MERRNNNNSSRAHGSRETFARPKCQDVSAFFDVIQLPFVVWLHICDVSSFQFNSNTHLSCIFIYLPSSFLFSCCRHLALSLFLCVCIQLHAHLPIVHTQYVNEFMLICAHIYNSQNISASKNINIRLWAVDTLFCPFCSFNSIEPAVVRSHDVPLYYFV